MPRRAGENGFVLIALIALLAMGGLYFFISNLTPEAIEARRQAKTEAALMQAREALIGYALQYRSQPASGDADAMYGHLPPPDLGDHTFAACTSEGCATTNSAVVTGNTVLVGRFPWKTVGTEPLRDGYGECLWYAISTSHRAVSSTATTMNWDTLAAPDIPYGSGPAGVAAVAAHQRPIAVIFSPGAAFNGGRTTSSNATECGGNYNSTHYIDATLNYAQRALSVTSDMIFSTLRKSSGLEPSFAFDINAMLDRMTECARDQLAANPALENVKIAPPCTTALDNYGPTGYYRNYSDQVFVTKCASCIVTVNKPPPGYVPPSSCAGALIFGNQRNSTQDRSDTGKQGQTINYLEDPNLASFGPPAGNVYTGDYGLMSTATQSLSQDIVRCIPTGASMSLVTSQPLADAGFGQLVAYNAATRTLTLGKENVTTGFFAPGTALFGCAWLADSRSLGNGFRTYFSFQFKKVGTSVGGNGFVFAMVDAVNNSLASCGAAGSHLGYSGYNGSTPKVKFPKIGVEFDQSKNTPFNDGRLDTATNKGRNDPCYTCGTGTFDTHAAIVYWGHESANLTDSVIDADYDDNVHGFPTAAALAGNLRPPPTNPAASPGLKAENLRGYPDSTYDSKLFYVRVEVKPSRNVNTSTPELSNTSIRTEVWIESDPNSVNQIAALRNTTRPMAQLYPTYSSTVNDTAVIYDIPVGGSSCNATTPCPATQACGTDNACYRPALQTLRLGFTGSQRTSDQEVNITDFFTTWLP
jgi:type II secretory pathway pseudopilin PulG